MQNVVILNYLLGFFSSAIILFFYHRHKMGSYDKFFKETFYNTDKEIEEKKHKLSLEIQQAKHEHEILCQQKLSQTHQSIEAKKKEWQLQEKGLSERLQKHQLESQALLQKQKNHELASKQLESDREAVDTLRNKLMSALESLSGLTQQQAQKQLFDQLSLQVKKDCALWQSKYFKEKKAHADQEAKKVIVQAIQRLSTECTSIACIKTINLPSEDFKSKIIGREGRNINFLEDTLGVNLLVDETPKSVVISTPDPFRKAVAYETLTKLIVDGRIHPTKIQEAYEQSKQEVEKQTYAKAESFAVELGITDLHPKIVKLLAKMDLMNSLGQNLLEHSYHVGLIMGIMASELELDPEKAKRIGFLHDIGKAAAAPMTGSHALVGQKICFKYGESSDVANGVGCHHGEVNAQTLEGSLCSAADSLSAARPGARTENIQHFIKRVKKLEAIAHSFPEVEKAYVLQSGKEIRVMAIPEKVDDDSLPLLAQSLAKKIEGQLNHAGKIKVSVMRQKEVVEFTAS